MPWYDFPGEDDDYRRSRAALLAEEIALRDQVERVAEIRRQLPPGKVMLDYVFREGPADLRLDDSCAIRDVHLTDLFGAHEALIVDHVMFSPADTEPCSMCSLGADGFNAVAPHIEQQAAFVLVAKAEIGALRDWARRRGWDRLRLLSCRGNTFNLDLGMESLEGEQYPGVSVFTRTSDGVVRHRYSIGANFNPQVNRGIDLLSPAWNLLDLLPAGRGDWSPAHRYMER